MVTEPLTLNQPETTTISLSKEDFGTDYDFWQLAIQPPSQFAFVNVTIYDIGRTWAAIAWHRRGGVCEMMLTTWQRMMTISSLSL